MTQLYIDNQEVALPEDFSFELIRENPMFNKGGDFTLDISLNLDIPVNARLYRHLNRFTATSNFKNRSARLIVDGRTVLNGTEIILEVNELSASIQLASGNSELNFLIGGDLKMSALDMGKVPILTAEQAKATYTLSYPNCNYVCSPAKAAFDNDMIFLNNFPQQILTYSKEKDTIYWENSNFLAPAEIRPMPYLNFMIEQCILSLGYTIRRNILRETVYNRLFIVHGSNPTTWGELLGEKTATEFLSDVENLFGVNIIVWPGKEVEILFRSDFYKNHSTLFTPRWVEERFERSYLNEDEQPSSYLKSNISYETQDNAYFKMQNVDPDIRKKLPEIRQPHLEGIKAAIRLTAPSFKDKLYNDIFVDEETGTEFILIKHENLEEDLNIVNRFGALTRENSKTEIELNIVPVEIECPNVLFQLYSHDPISGRDVIITTVRNQITLPVVDKYVPMEESSITAEQAINGTEKTTQNVERIAVAFWNGCKTIHMGTGFQKVYFPFPTTHYLAPWFYQDYEIIDETKASLSLKDLNKDLYEKNTLFDPEQEHTIHALLEGVIPNASDTFLVKGKKFIVKSISLKVTPDGFDPEYQATLYAML